MRKPITPKLTQARIDQLSNDASEDIRTGTASEWRAVAMHFKAQADEARRLLLQLDSSITLRRTCQHFEDNNIEEILTWAEKQKSQIKKP